MATEEKKSGKDRIQPATRNEEWDDDRIRAFMSLEPAEGVPADYHILLKAYRAMVPEFYARFVPMFVAAGRDVNVRLADGSTILDHLSRHRRAGPYIKALEQSGAVRGKTD
jgi:hypothetical protein